MPYFNEQQPFKNKSSIIASREPLNDLMKRMGNSPNSGYKSIGPCYGQGPCQGIQNWNTDNYNRPPISVNNDITHSSYNSFDGTPGGAWKNPYSG